MKALYKIISLLEQILVRLNDIDEEIIRANTRIPSGQRPASKKAAIDRGTLESKVVAYLRKKYEGKPFEYSPNALAREMLDDKTLKNNSFNSIVQKICDLKGRGIIEVAYKQNQTPLGKLL